MTELFDQVRTALRGQPALVGCALESVAWLVDERRLHSSIWRQPDGGLLRVAVDQVVERYAIVERAGGRYYAALDPVTGQPWAWYDIDPVGRREIKRAWASDAVLQVNHLLRGPRDLPRAVRSALPAEWQPFAAIYAEKPYGRLVELFPAAADLWFRDQPARPRRPRLPRPGDTVAFLATRWGYEITTSCGCQSLRHRWNAWGWRECYRQRGQIAVDLATELALRGIAVDRLTIGAVVWAAWRERQRQRRGYRE